MARIRHIAIVTSNQKKLADFYKTAFGMKEVKGIGEALYLSDGYFNLALIEKTPDLKVAYKAPAKSWYAAGVGS